MAKDESQTAPYAPLHNVLTVIRRLRDRGLPNPLTLKELERTGVPEGNAPRTLATLRGLGLIGEDGFHTPACERLGKATTTDYPGVLAEIVRAAYAPVFTLVDPSVDSEIAIQDAFRHYKPQAQRSRMVALFIGLCREAGIVAGGPPTRKAKMRRGVTVTASGKVTGSSDLRAKAQVVRASGPSVAMPETTELHIKTFPPTIHVGGRNWTIG